MQGSPESIKRNHGIGYELSFRNLTPAGKQTLIDSVNDIFGSEEQIELNLGDFALNQKASLIIPLSSVASTSRLLSRLEESNIEFGLKANTLEEAFVKMGEKEFKTSTD